MRIGAVHGKGPGGSSVRGRNMLVCIICNIYICTVLLYKHCEHCYWEISIDVDDADPLLVIKGEWHFCDWRRE